MITIGDTLSTRAAIDAQVAAGTIVPQLRADDAAGQAAMKACLAGGASQAECNAQIGSSIDSKGFFCTQTLSITAAGKVCGPDNTPSVAKAAALLKEAQATAAANAAPSSTPLIVGGVIVAGVLAWLAFR